MSARRTASALLGALAAILLLAGCVGIPTSGPVVAGPGVDEIDPEYVVTPNGPADGADPTAILNGFMQAVRAPQADYQVARQFLTPQFALLWDPNAGVAIRSGPADITVGGTGAAPVLGYEFASAASVDAEGRYRETATEGTRSLEFSFAQVDGQWRISSAPNGVVLGEASFERVFAAYALYFFDPSGTILVPDLRWFPVRQSTPSVVVAALLAGPDDWLARAVVTDFPAGTALGPRSVVVADGRATVDLSSQVATATPQELDRMHQQLVATLDVVDVAILADGVPLRIVQAAPQAIIDPQPSGTTLVGTDTDFGHAGPTGIVPIDGVTSVLVADGATAGVLSADQATAAYRAADGSVRRAAGGSSTPIDDRAGLVAPGLDAYGWTWSGGLGAALGAFDAEGVSSGLVASSIPADAAVVAIAVSRDATRIAVGLASASGPRLLVFGIVRSGGTPTALDPPLELPIADGIASVAWVDDRSLVVVTEAAVGRAVRVVGLGAPGESLGAIPAGGVAVGGRGGVAGIRAIADGVVLAPAASDGWTEAGFTGRYLGVQQ